MKTRLTVRGLTVLLGTGPPRYLSVADAARAAGLSQRAVYRAIQRGELTASHVCSRLRIHPDDFLAWMDGDDATMRRPPATSARVGMRAALAADGLRDLLTKRSSRPDEPADGRSAA